MGNKKTKEKLIELYGPECFIDKLHLRKYDKPVHYTSRGQRERMKQLTYHHIKMRKDGGKSTVENGALLSEENHIWFHKQSKEKQRKMNNAFQEYKKCKVEFSDIPEQPFELSFAEIEITDKLKVKPINRAKIKEETRKAYKKYLEEKENE